MKKQQTDARKATRKKQQQSDAGKAKQSKANKKNRSTIRGYLRVVFDNMIRRCNNPNDPHYNRYGERGIEVRFTLDGFRDYVIDVLKVDPRGLDIDRINNDGNYEIGNIRFISHKANCQNRSKPKTKNRPDRQNQA